MKRELFLLIKQFPLDYNSTQISQCLVCYVYNSMNNRATITHNAKQRANNSTGHLTGVYAHLYKISVSCDVSYTQYNQIYQSVYCSMRLHVTIVSDSLFEYYSSSYVCKDLIYLADTTY